MRDAEEEQHGGTLVRCQYVMTDHTYSLDNVCTAIQKEGKGGVCLHPPHYPAWRHTWIVQVERQFDDHAASR